MNFEDFCRSYGLILEYAISDNRWHRVVTDDHLKKKNGAYCFDGQRGVCQNWATMNEPAVFKSERPVTSRQNAVSIAQSLENERKKNAEAREAAKAMIAECTRGTHEYLARKGFPEAQGFVHPSGDLVIPMRDCAAYGTINGVQRVSPDGAKKFIQGMRAKGAVFTIGKGARGERFLCEGYATGLSIQAALIDMYKRCEVVVCFSAGNLKFVAKSIKKPAYVIADNDVSLAGEEAAIETGLPWTMPPEVGMDANDLHLKAGLRAVAKLLLQVGS